MCVCVCVCVILKFKFVNSDLIVIHLLYTDMKLLRNKSKSHLKKRKNFLGNLKS